MIRVTTNPLSTGIRFKMMNTLLSTRIDSVQPPYSFKLPSHDSMIRLAYIIITITKSVYLVTRVCTPTHSYIFCFSVSFIFERCLEFHLRKKQRLYRLGMIRRGVSWAAKEKKK